MSELVETKKSLIPSISDERLCELCERIKPVVAMARIRTESEKHDDGSATIRLRVDPAGELQPWDTGELYFIKPVDPRKISFRWDPEPYKKATGLKELCKITTYHTYGYHGFFKPSIAEVIAQIPEKYLDKVVAFETRGPATAADLNKHREILNAGYHVATTTLFSR